MITRLKLLFLVLVFGVRVRKRDTHTLVTFPPRARAMMEAATAHALRDVALHGLDFDVQVGEHSKMITVTDGDEHESIIIIEERA